MDDIISARVLDGMIAGGDGVREGFIGQIDGRGDGELGAFLAMLDETRTINSGALNHIRHFARRLWRRVEAEELKRADFENGECHETPLVDSVVVGFIRSGLYELHREHFARTSRVVTRTTPLIVVDVLDIPISIPLPLHDVFCRLFRGYGITFEEFL